MFSQTKIVALLSGTVFLAACLYVGYANELLKNAVSPTHRVILLVGFLLGAVAIPRWIMGLDIQRNMRRIRRARSERLNDH